MSGWMNAHHGALAADALAMPVHWYYDREALRRDYGTVDHFLAPRKFHPDSILWRSSYEAPNEKGDILREQAQYWGQRGIHYHQFLQAGENTLNFRLAAELYHWVRERGGYDADAWPGHYVERMLEPGWHRDTYVEEYHREFFKRHAAGKPLRKCGIRDVHIGGLATVPALLAALEGMSREELRLIVREHVGLTHADDGVLGAADALVRLLWAIVVDGAGPRDAIRTEAGDWLSGSKAEKWVMLTDLEVVGAKLSPACYIDGAMPAALFIAWKYHDDVAGGLTANAMVGGDSCHRGAVVGSLLAAAAGGVPPHLLQK